MLHHVFKFLAHGVFFVLIGLFMIGGDTLIVYVSCFTLLIDLYLLVIHDICLYFVLCEIKKLFCFACIFHTCVYGFVERFRKYIG